MQAVKTNVRHGAIIGGWVCFILGALVMLMSFWGFMFYAPLLFAAFVLSIVAMSQRAVAAGIALLLCCVVGPPLIFVVSLALGAHRSTNAATGGTSARDDELRKAVERNARIDKVIAESATSLPSATAAAEATPSPIPTAVSLASVIDNAKTKMNSSSTSEELKDMKTQLLAIPRSSARYSEVQEMLRRLDRYIDTATKAEERAVRRAASHWTYSEQNDEMGRGVSKFARISSENELNFGFPYSGGQHAELTVRSSPKYGKDVYVWIERGQFLCSSFDGCKISVRFDDGGLQTFTGREASNGDPKFLFITPYDRFISQLRKAKRLRVEAEFYQEASRMMEFNIADLDW